MGVSISIDEKSLKKDFCLICEQCFNNKEIPLPRNLKIENFEISTVYNLFSKEKINLKLIEKIKEQKWTPEENKKLMESMKKNNNWDDVVKSLGKNNHKTKKDCILHLMQMPITMINSKEEEIDISSNQVDDNKFDGTFTVTKGDKYTVKCANYEGGKITTATEKVENPATGDKVLKYGIILGICVLGLARLTINKKAKEN